MLNKDDLRNVVLHLPKDIREQMKRRQGKLFLGGGFIRAVIAGEKISDIDMFGHNKDVLIQIGYKLATDRGHTKTHITKNAMTVLTENRLPVQFITRWLFDAPEELAKSFDFTVCQSVVYYMNGEWHSITHESFYSDLAAKRLRYTYPQREEEAGGSMLRVMKYVKRGYSISPESLGGVMARVTKSLTDHSDFPYGKEMEIAKLTQAKLREVDPLLIIDGLHIEDDHEMPDDDIPMLPVKAPDFDDIPF